MAELKVPLGIDSNKNLFKPVDATKNINYFCPACYDCSVPRIVSANLPSRLAA
jgi:hypothetical protein